jgi:hypothetical protein
MIEDWNSGDLEACGSEHDLDFGLSMERAAKAMDVEEAVHWKPEFQTVK